MLSVIEPLYKATTEIKFGWKPEPEATKYRIYVGLSALTVTTLLYDDIPPYPSKNPQDLGKVSWTVKLTDVLAALGLTSGTFQDRVFFFTLTYADSAGVWSSLSDSKVVEVPPVGISPSLLKDDPIRYRQEHIFAPEIQRWVKMVGSADGAVAVHSSDYFKPNITTEYTYDGTNLIAVKAYLNDATTGSPAKLTTYEYSSGKLVKVIVTDSTV